MSSTPAGVPKPTIDLLAEATRNVMSDVELRQLLLASGFEPTAQSGPDAAQDLVRRELARWTPIIKATSFKVE